MVGRTRTTDKRGRHTCTGTALLAALGLSLAMVAVPGTAVSADVAVAPGHQPEILASDEPGALPADRYLGDFYATFLPTDLDVGIPDYLFFGPRKVVLAYGGPAFCTIHQGAPVLVEGWANEISSIEAPFSSDSAVQLQTARDFDYAMTRSLTVSVDGGAPVDVRTPQFEATSTQRTVRLPANNLFGVDPQVITLTAHGWLATVRGLSAGMHHIVITRVLDFGAGPETFVLDQAVRVTTGS